jgi:phosphoglycolate phosphatase-like HAD superfamily hydrolase
MQKKLIFFDGDGTLWYPKKTKRTQKPHWIYSDPKTKDSYLEHLELTPGTKEVFNYLHQKNIYIVVVSANPFPEDVANIELKEKLKYFNLIDLVYAYRSSSGDNPDGKATIMLEIIRTLKLKKEQALMVGDSYFYDYLAAKNIGIEALFIKNSVSKMPEKIPNNLKTIREVSDLMAIIVS